MDPDRVPVAWATTGSGPEKGPGAGPEAIADSPTLGAGLGQLQRLSDIHMIRLEKVYRDSLWLATCIPSETTLKPQERSRGSTKSTLTWSKTPLWYLKRCQGGLSVSPSCAGTQPRPWLPSEGLGQTDLVPDTFVKGPHPQLRKTVDAVEELPPPASRPHWTWPAVGNIE